MLGVTQNPTVTPVRRRAALGRPGHGRRSSFRLTPVGVFFGREGSQEPGVTVADPYFGGAGPAADRLHPVRRVHDRLPGGREEHAGQELPAPRRVGRGGRARGHHRRSRSGRARRAAGSSRPVETGSWPRRRPARSPPTPSCSRPAPWAPRSCSTRMRGRGVLPRLSPPARRADPHQLRVAPRRADDDGQGGLHPGRRHHVARSTPTRSPTSSRAATARAATSWACCRRC